MSNRAVFLDRDGTINVDVGYLYRPEDFVFEFRAAEAIKALNDEGFKVIVISNQSGIARGYYTLSDVDLLHEYLNSELAKNGAKIDAFYICPHGPNDNCECRKPKPALVFRAAEDHNISLHDSWMVGDKPSDIECAKNAGIQAVMVDSIHKTENCAQYENLYEFTISLSSQKKES